MGRFLTADPYRASGGPANPQSWNRYAYVEGDPINNVDPTGLFLQAPHDFGFGGQPLDVIFGFRRELDYPLTPRQKKDALNQARTGVRLDEAMGVALKALEDPDCAKLFQGREGAPDPAALLAALQSGSSSYGYITIDTETSRPGSKTNAVTRATFGYAVGPNGRLVNTGVNGAVVTINSDQSSPFNSTYNTVDRAVTVLHELGHVYELLSVLAPAKSKTTRMTRGGAWITRLW